MRAIVRDTWETEDESPVDCEMCGEEFPMNETVDITERETGANYTLCQQCARRRF